MLLLAQTVVKKHVSQKQCKTNSVGAVVHMCRYDHHKGAHECTTGRAQGLNGGFSKQNQCSEMTNALMWAAGRSLEEPTNLQLPYKNKEGQHQCETQRKQGQQNKRMQKSCYQPKEPNKRQLSISQTRLSHDYLQYPDPAEVASTFIGHRGYIIQCSLSGCLLNTCYRLGAVRGWECKYEKNTGQ